MDTLTTIIADHTSNGRREVNQGPQAVDAESQRERQRETQSQSIHPE